MKKKQIIATGLSAAVAMSSVALPSAQALGGLSAAAKGTTAQPNIVYIMLDDTGYGEFSCYGNEFNETPNIDKVASEGARFTQFYTQPVCSPSRGCLMTGNNPLRNGVTNFLDNVNSYLNPDEFETMPQMMNRAGYHTGIIGKWHLNAGNRYNTSPGIAEKHGWNEVIMSERNPIGNGDYYYTYSHLPQVTGLEPNAYLPDVMSDEAVKYIRRNAQSDQPFMLYLSHYATHTNLTAPQETVDYFQNKRGKNVPAGEANTTHDRNPYLAAMLKHVDNGVGEIDSVLEELGIKDNTIVVIAGDNGGETRVTTNGILRGGKRQLYEGGLRNPMIIRWPQSMSGGRTIDYPVSMTDFYQTFGEASGLSKTEIPQNSGVSLMPILTESGFPDRDTLYWCYPRNTQDQPGYKLTNKTELVEGGAIRKGDYKYIESFAFEDRRELYDLSKDPSETTNIISEHRDIYRELSRKLHESLEKDTIGKKFTATFDDSENYRWSTRGTHAKSGGVLTAGRSTTNVTTVADYLYYDAQTTLDVKPVNKGRAGLVFRSNLAGPGNEQFKAYAATINAAHGKIELLNLKGKYATVIASAPLEVNPENTYKIKVETDSDLIKVYVGDQLKLEVTDESYFFGSVGVYSDGSSARLDNLIAVGVEGERPVSDCQLNIKNPGTKVITIDGRQQSYDTAPQLVGNTLFAQVQKLASALGLDFSFNAASQTAELKNSETSLKLTVGSNTAIVNGESKTMPGAAKLTDGELMAPVSFIADCFGFEYDDSQDEFALSSAYSALITDQSEKITYSGSWTVIPSDTNYGGSAMRAAAAGATASMSFSGKAVRLYLSRGTAAGILKVYLDGALEATIDSYNASALGKSMMFEKSGLSAGLHTIKAECTGTKGSLSRGTNVNIDAFEVVKRSYPVESVTLGKTQTTIKAGKTETLLSYMFPANASDKTLVWSSSDESVASVSAGKITAQKPGKAVIKAQSSNPGEAAECEVTVVEGDPVDIAATGVSLSPQAKTVNEGDSFTLSAKVMPDGATDKAVSFGSSDGSVAAVDQSGRVTAVKQGIAVITARVKKTPQIMATCLVTVHKKEIKTTGLSVSKPKLTLEKGKKYTLKSTVKPGNAANRTVKWSSSNSAVAQVDGGRIKAKKAGRATITASCAGFTARCVVTVKARITKISFKRKKYSLKKGSKLNLDKKIKSTSPSAKFALKPKYSWTVPKKYKKLVSVKKGVVKGLKKGKADVYVYVNKKRVGRVTVKIV